MKKDRHNPKGGKTPIELDSPEAEPETEQVHVNNISIMIESHQKLVGDGSIPMDALSLTNTVTTLEKSLIALKWLETSVAKK